MVAVATAVVASAFDSVRARTAEANKVTCLVDEDKDFILISIPKAEFIKQLAPTKASLEKGSPSYGCTIVAPTFEATFTHPETGAEVKRTVAPSWRGMWLGLFAASE